MIQAILKTESGEVTHMEFHDWKEYSRYVDETHGTYIDMDAHEVKPADIRQGRFAGRTVRFV